MADFGSLGDGADVAIVSTDIKRFPRRTFLGWGLLLACVGVGRRLWAQGARYLRYRSLSRPVVIPLRSLAVPGRARRFVAQGVSPPTAANPDQPVRVNGMVVRVSDEDNNPDRFKAVCAVCPHNNPDRFWCSPRGRDCAVCPHEQCEVDFVPDPSTLDPLVLAEIGDVTDPVYLCPCHNSTFTMTEGEPLGGPAPRGLYRFRVTAVTDAAVEIGEVEEDVLLFF